jgi:membrane protease subunit (stomatin/prohibitin family)
MRIGDPAVFLKEIAGTDGYFTTNEIKDQLRNIIVSRFSNILGESGIPILDLAANYDDLSDFVTAQISPEFKEYGLGLSKFLVENISLPKKVEEALDNRTSMGIVGNLRNYAAFQAAESMREAARNPADGGAAAGIGMGMGFAMAKKLGDAFSIAPDGVHGTAPASEETPPPLPLTTKYFIAVRGKPEGPYTLDDLDGMSSTHKLKAKTLVWRSGMKAWQPANSLDELRDILADVPPPLPKKA